MGRYDGPHFGCEDRDVVSIWVAHANLGAFPKDYMEPDHLGDGDDPWSPFAENFGFGYFDDDICESFAQPSKRKASLYKQLQFLSYSASFINEAVAEAEKRKLDKTAWVWLMYNFAYDPKVTGIRRDDYMEFLGVFPFDVESESAERYEG